MGWRSVPPPYSIKKPLFSRNPPVGALKTSGRTPAETIQVIRPTGKEPKSLSVDLGISDIFITGGANPSIQFRGEGLHTDVGRRLPEPEKGLSIPEEPYLRALSTKRVKSKKKKRTSRRLSDYDYTTTLKGFTP